MEKCSIKSIKYSVQDIQEGMDDMRLNQSSVDLGFCHFLILSVSLLLLIGCDDGNEVNSSTDPDATSHFVAANPELATADMDHATSSATMPSLSPELEANYKRLKKIYETGHISELAFDTAEFQGLLKDLRGTINLGDYPLDMASRKKGAFLVQAYKNETHPLQDLLKTVLLWQYMQYLESNSEADKKLYQHAHEFAVATQWCSGDTITTAEKAMKSGMDMVIKRKEEIEGAAELEKLKDISMVKNEVLNLILLSACWRLAER